MEEKVVITGMGAITPLGHTLSESWLNMTNGESGLGPLTLCNSVNLNVKLACEVKNFDPAHYMSAKQARRRDRYEQFTFIAVQEALEQSGLEIAEANADRIGVVISTGGGGLMTISEMEDVLRKEGHRRVSPFSSAMFMPNGAAGMTSIDIGARGPCFSVSSACASGGDGLGVAWMMLKMGAIDVAIAGASEAPITELVIAGLDRAGAMSRRTLAEGLTPQPFDLNRDGFVIGEGAAVLTLERESFARARRADIFAEFAGYGASADAFHITAPREDASGPIQAMQRALESAGVDPLDVDYINAHGTGTRLNDVVETEAIKSLFGPHACDLMVSSTKSMTGHMVGATPAFEAALAVMAICKGTVLPTINYETPDPLCDLDYVPNEPRQASVRCAMSNSFGFGGHNSVLVFKEYF